MRAVAFYCISLVFRVQCKRMHNKRVFSRKFMQTKDKKSTAIVAKHIEHSGGEGILNH